MAGGWASVADEQGRYYGAGTLEAGGDVEEFAQCAYGMVWWLAAQQVSPVAPDVRERIMALIERAWEHWEQGLAIGGQADDEGEY